MIINQDRAQVISVSWGQCEAVQGAGALNAESTLFAQAAVQGQTIVAAAGDNGSADCAGPGAAGETQLAVDDPAGQPYVTGVGGTSLNAIGPRPSETVWNTRGGPLRAGQAPGAGGGGSSSFWAMAPSQRSAPAALNVIGPGSSGAACGNPGGYCREVPDVSADANPATGYLVYWNGEDAVAGQATQWQGIGGTSGATPVWAALIALSDASPACGGTPVGFANPAIYRAAADAYAADFNDIASGDNDLFATNAGLYAAGAGYDMATGLGTPDAAALVTALCADSLAIATPRTQRSPLHAVIGLRLSARDVPGAKLAYRAAGLPPGLSLNGASGWISGRSRRSGAYTVTVSARDSAGAISQTMFRWTIAAPPRVSAAVISGLGTGRPRLTLTLSAGAGGGSIQAVSLRLPDGPRLVSDDAVTVSAPGVRRIRFSARLVRGSLVIRLRGPAAKLRVTVGYRALRGGSALPGHADRPRLDLSLLAGGTATRVSIGLRRAS